MPNSLTDTNISDTYKQVLHVSAGVGNATQKRVRDGDGTATAIMVSSLGAQDGIKGVSVDGKSSADELDLNAYDSTKQQIGDNLIRAMVDLFYPIGSLYIQGDVIDRAEQSDGTFKNDAYVANPETRFPGTTWERVSKGRVLMGVGNILNEPTPGGYTRSTEKDPYSGLDKFNYDAAEVAKSDMYDPSGNNLRVFAGPDVWWYELDGNINYWDGGDTKISGYSNFRVGYYESQIDSTNIPVPPHTHAIYTTTYQGGDDCAWNNNSAGGRMGGNDIGRAVRNSTQNGGKGARVQGCVAHEVLSVGGGTPPDTVDISTTAPYYGVFIWKRVK